MIFIPEDRTIIEECKLYETFRAKLELDFMLRQKGKTDSKYGLIHGSVQENSYLETYLNNYEILKWVFKHFFYFAIIDIGDTYGYQRKFRY